jgi:hypothetical protein
MTTPLMPTATAVWLVENTTLTFEQIGAFCELHTLEVQGIADDEVAIGIVGLDPISNGQLTLDEIERCAADSKARLRLAQTGVPRPRARAKGARYTPLSKRQDRPDAISWILRIHPEISDPQIVKLLGTTKATINAVRDRTHWNSSNIKPQDPVSLGICTQAELDEAVTKAQAKLRAREEREAKERAKAERAAAKEAEATPAALDAPTEEAATEEPGAEATTTEDAPAAPDAPAEETAAPDAPAEETAAPDAPAEETVAADAPAEEAPAAPEPPAPEPTAEEPTAPEPTAETPPSEHITESTEDDSGAERPSPWGSDRNA